MFQHLIDLVRDDRAVKNIFLIIIAIYFLVEIVMYYYSAKTGKELKYNRLPKSIVNFLLNNFLAVEDKSYTLPDEKTILDLGAESYLIYLIQTSKKLAQTIFYRAVAYFNVGLLVSIIGIIFLAFFDKISHAANPSISTADHLYLYLERFGSSIFIELIAFFIFKQFRITMDEFKHFDSLSRNRETHLALFKTINSDLTPEKKEALLKSINFYAEPGVLKKGESTNIIEERKLTNDEINLLYNFINPKRKEKP